MRISENRLLVWEATRIGKTHEREQLILGYRNALDAAMDPRCRGAQRTSAIQSARRAEAALRQFVYPQAVDCEVVRYGAR